MIKVLISVLILASVVLADGAEYCDKGTKYTSFAGKLEKGQSLGDFCECIRKNLINTGVLNETSTFTCSRNSNLSKLKWTISSDVKEDLGCTKCLNGGFNTDGDVKAACEVIRDSKRPQTSALKRVSRQAMEVSFYVEAMVIIETYVIEGYVITVITVYYYEVRQISVEY